MDEVNLRLERLESRHAYQENILDTLNDVLVAQQKQLDAMAHELARMRERMDAAWERLETSRSLQDEVPPHY